MKNGTFKVRSGFKPIKYFKPFLASLFCFGLFLKLTDFENLKSDSLVMLLLSISCFAYALYYFLGFVLSIKGRYLTIGDEFLCIPHEYIPIFDKKIKILDIVNIDKKQVPVDVIVVTLKTSDKVIITSELLLKNSIQEVYETIIGKIEMQKNI